MPYIKTSLTDREVHLLRAAIEAVGSAPSSRNRRNATLASHVRREYAGLQELLGRFVEDLSGGNDIDAAPLRVKPFMSGQKLFKFNIYSRSIAFGSGRSEGSSDTFEAVPLPDDYYAIMRDVDWDSNLEIFHDFNIWNYDGRRLVGSSLSVERVRTGIESDRELHVNDDCTCDEGVPCESTEPILYTDQLPVKYSAYIPATSPILEYLTTQRRRRCRDEMLADMSGSLLPLLSHDDLRVALNINRSGLRYADDSSLLFAHKLVSLASIATAATEQQLENTQTIATFDVIL